MTVRIITAAPTEHRAQCSKCGCRFVYTVNDLHHSYIGALDWVGCPSCGKSFTHPDQRLKSIG
jgi:hypothetical protein